mmetsp:Transcript_1512/g.2195  ORF Transcript_1512/g.2195 Transcript_1512/m.2195 type:complete len:157 (-) Transcript_1512:1750-2220(-)
MSDRPQVLVFDYGTAAFLLSQRLLSACYNAQKKEKQDISSLSKQRQEKVLKEILPLTVTVEEALCAQSSYKGINVSWSISRSLWIVNQEDPVGRLGQEREQNLEKDTSVLELRNIVLSSKESIHRFNVFMDFWNQGWTLTPGSTYGVDFLAYQGMF